MPKVLNARESKCFPKCTFLVVVFVCLQIPVHGTAQQAKNITSDLPEVVLQVPHAAWITAIAVSRDGKHYATSSADATIEMWDAGAGLMERVLKGPPRVRNRHLLLSGLPVSRIRIRRWVRSRLGSCHWTDDAKTGSRCAGREGPLESRRKADCGNRRQSNWALTWDTTNWSRTQLPESNGGTPPQCRSIQ